MASILGNYFANTALQLYFVTPGTWLALHTEDPTATGDISTEVTGGGYERQLMHWSTASNRTIATTNAQVFSDMPQVTVGWLGIWNGNSGQHLLARIGLGTPRFIPASGQFLSLAGDISLTL